jgi:uncharacterized protein YecE (DUF72 family)
VERGPHLRIGCCGFVAAQTQYFRLHGITGHRYRYTEGDLKHLREWVERKPTYVLFNNDSMKEDALRFLEMTKGGRNGEEKGR